MKLLGLKQGPTTHCVVACVRTEEGKHAVAYRDKTSFPFWIHVTDWADGHWVWANEPFAEDDPVEHFLNALADGDLPPLPSPPTVPFSVRDMLCPTPPPAPKPVTRRKLSIQTRTRRIFRPS